MISATEKNLNVHILWWGRSTISYSRNGVIRQCLERLGCTLTQFRPLVSRFAAIEARLRRTQKPDIIWLPCFCHKDMPAASSWSKRLGVPIVYDPLISAYDKQVFERKKFIPASSQAKQIFRWEKQLFQNADLVIGDTEEHVNYFHKTFAVDRDKLAVVPVGAEESMFYPEPLGKTEDTGRKGPLTVLFFGSFLGLQGPETIIEAALNYLGPKVKWKMVGDGPLLQQCRQLAGEHPNIEFLPWTAYEELPKIIRSADILLGIFGTSDKANRVIPNKVYQALACGKPLVTMSSPAFPPNFTDNDNLGIEWVEPGNSRELAAAIAYLARHPEELPGLGIQARKTYETHFSEAGIQDRLARAIRPLLRT